MRSRLPPIAWPAAPPRPARFTCAAAGFLPRAPPRARPQSCARWRGGVNSIYKLPDSQEELRAGEEIARCPSCSLFVTVVYNPEDFAPKGGVEDEGGTGAAVTV